MRAELARLRVLDDLLPDPLGFAGDDRVGVLEAFLGERRDVDAAEHDLAPALAVRVGDRVRSAQRSSS